MRRFLLILMLIAVLGGLLFGGLSTATPSPATGEDVVLEWLIDRPLGDKEVKALQSNRIVFAIDNSGSVKAVGRLGFEKLRAKARLKKIGVWGLNPWIEVIAFNSDIQVIKRGFYNDIKDEVESAIESIQDTDNLTWMNGAIEYATSNACGPDRSNALYLLTDGKPTTPERNGPKAIPAAVAATIAAANFYKANCSILFVVGIDVSGEEEEFLREVASPDAYVSATAISDTCISATGLRVPQDYSTIEAAVDAAEASDAIFIDPGTYVEHPIIYKDILLCGAGADLTTLEGGIIVGGGQVHIEGLDIALGNSGIAVSHYAKATIIHNIIEFNDYDGITVWNLGEADISYNIIRYNGKCGVRKEERATVTGFGNEIYDNGQDLCPSEEDFPPGFRVGS